MNTVSLFNPVLASDIFDVLDRTFSNMSESSATCGATFSPRVDISEKKEAYTLEMELPGYGQNDVSIDLKDRVLTVASLAKETDRKEEKAEQKAEKKDPTYWIMKERRTGSFSRSFTLPDDMDAEHISAAFVNGLLTITVPRRQESQARRIEIL